MIQNRKVAVVIGNANDEGIYETIKNISKQLYNRGFIVISPFPYLENVLDAFAERFSRAERFEQMEAAVSVADLIVMENTKGITDDMEFFANANPRADVMWVIPKEDVNGEISET